MAKRGENIYLRKDGRWEGRYIKGRRLDGKPQFGYVYGRKYSKVKQELVLLKARNAGKSNIATAYGSGRVAEWLGFWLETLVKPYIAETTYHTYKTQMERHLIPEIGEGLLRELGTEEIQSFVNEKREKLSAGMLHNVYRLLRSALKAAQEKRLIRDNPCVGVKLPKNKGKAPRVLSRREQQKLEREAVREGSLEYLLCLYTGLRLGELCALQWADVHFVHHAIIVRHTMKRVKGTVRMGTPKSENSEREVPVPAFVMKLLREKMEQEGADGFIFGSGQSAASMRTMQARLKAMTKRIGLKGVHMHTLRHTYATRCLENRIGVETLCDLLGHSGPQITLKYYAHCTRENKFACVKKLKQIAC